jgi:hypothetical protein
MARFKNLQLHAVDLYRPAGHPDSLHVEADQVVEVPASVTEELDDAWITGEGDNRLAWPKANWALDKPAKASAKAKDGDS